MAWLDETIEVPRWLLLALAAGRGSEGLLKVLEAAEGRALPDEGPRRTRDDDPSRERLAGWASVVPDVGRDFEWDPD